MSDRPEFARVFEEEVWSVYGFFGYRVRSRVVCEDLTQLTFEKALRSWRRYDPKRSEPRVWLIAIARNVLIDYFRAAGRRQETISADPSDHDLHDVDPGPGNMGTEISGELETALATLTSREREILGLRFGADLATAEIAGIMGLTAANVQQVLSRTLRKLRTTLSEELQPER